MTIQQINNRLKIISERIMGFEREMMKMSVGQGWRDRLNAVDDLVRERNQLEGQLIMLGE